MSAEQQKIGKYTIVSQIGKGGMGVVYKAFDPTIGRTLAIKTIRFDQAGPQMAQEEAQARFLREARSIGSLSHPNIVTIYEVGEDQGTSFIAMEYVEGSSLEELLGQGKKFTRIEAVRLIIQLADALGHAHRRDIVHRDVKPGNILIDQEGRPRLVDFGIARISTSTITQANAILGTPHYMSPEQITGKAVDCRADIFSVGAILYELLTSEKPFQGDQISTIIYKIVNEEPLPLRNYVKDLPEGLNAIVHKALAKDPARRYQACGDLVGDLNDYLRGAVPSPAHGRRKEDTPKPGATIRIPPAGLPPQKARISDEAAAASDAAPRKRGWLWGGLLVTLAGLGVVGFFLLKTPTQRRSAPPFSEQTGPSTPSTSPDREPAVKEVRQDAPADKAATLMSDTLKSPDKTETPITVKEKAATADRSAAVVVTHTAPPSPKTPKVREDKPALLAGFLAAGRADLDQGDFPKAFEAAMSALRLDPASAEAQELWTSASLPLAPLEINHTVDLYVQSFRDKSTSEFLQAHCAPELFQKLRKDVELLFGQFESFESAASDNSFTLDSGPGRLEADLKFGLSVTGRAVSSGSKRTLVEGFYSWRLRKSGERWTITEIRFEPLKK